MARMIAVRFLVILGFFLVALPGARGQSDPLPSWNNSQARSAIMDFVARVTGDGPDHVRPEQRIAVFDNDGTLWCEQPLYFQAVFAADRARAQASRNRELSARQPFKALLERNREAFAATGEKGISEIMAATHAGMTTEAFTKDVLDWIATARHPRFGRLYTELAYKPMQELLAYLRASGFKTFIVSGGGIDFMRPWTEKVYGISPEQVVGSSGVTQYRIVGDNKPELMKLAKVEFVDDGAGKPAGIHRFIGRRPIMAFGNSDGDRQMLEWTAAGPGPRFAAVVHHTDDVREYAYDRTSRIGKLDKLLDEARVNGWTVVDMKRDWRRIFAFEP